MISKIDRGFLSLMICTTLAIGATTCSAHAADEAITTPTVPDSTPDATKLEPKPVLEDTRLDIPPNKPDPFAARKADLSSRIENIKSSGAGVTPFLHQMDEIDALQKAKTPDETIAKRYDSLSHSIDDQISRMQALKQYHPVATPSHLSSGGAPGSNSQIMDMVKQRFGDRIPAGMSDEKLMQVLKNNPRAQQALQGLKLK